MSDPDLPARDLARPDSGRCLEMVSDLVAGRSTLRFDGADVLRVDRTGLVLLATIIDHATALHAAHADLVARGQLDPAEPTAITPAAADDLTHDDG
jgi:hypothetical protein